MSSKDQIEVHRLKARIPFSNGVVKIVQGVREVFEILDEPKGDPLLNPTFGKIVLIGRHFQGRNFDSSFNESVCK